MLHSRGFSVLDSSASRRWVQLLTLSFVGIVLTGSLWAQSPPTSKPSFSKGPLEQAIDAAFQRAKSADQAVESLAILEVTREGQTWRTYDGAWFSLESTADDATTRRCISRIEQTFRAYRLLLPPKITKRGNLRVRLHGSMDDYRTYLRTLGLDIALSLIHI